MFGALYIIFLILLVVTVLAWMSLAPWVPTRKKDLELISQVARLGPGDSFLEIGAGTARVSAYIAKKNPMVTVEAVELAFPFFCYIWIYQKCFGPKNLRVRFGNALYMDLSQYTVIYVFGMIDTLEKKLRPVYEKKTLGNTRLLSYFFAIAAWKDKEVQHSIPSSDKLFLYEYRF